MHSDANDVAQWTSNDDANLVPHGAAYSTTDTTALAGESPTVEVYVSRDNALLLHHGCYRTKRHAIVIGLQSFVPLSWSDTILVAKRSAHNDANLATHHPTHSSAFSITVEGNEP